jgi:hypothetical protein
MTFTARVGGSRVGFLGLLLALILLPALVATASNTNVFLLKNSLKAATESATGIQAIKFKANPRFLLGTNDTLTLAVAVFDLECAAAGLQPHFQLVAYDNNARHIAQTLVDFLDPTFIFNGDKSAVIRAHGAGGAGVNAADLETLINFNYEPCSTTGATAVVRSIQIQPVGVLKPAINPSAIPPNGTLLSDAGQFEILSDDPQSPRILLPISGQAKRPIAGCDIDLNLTTIDFGSIGVGTNATQSFQIRNNGDSLCTIAAIDINPNNRFTRAPLTFPIALAPSAYTNIDITFTATSTNAQSAKVRVICPDAVNPTQIVSVAGAGVTGVVDCHLTVSPTSLNFGTVEVTGTSNLNVTIANPGSTTCRVDNVTLITTSEFALVSAPLADFEIAPGTSVVVSVQYAPTDFNRDVGTLQIISANSNQFDLVSLTGSGKVAQCAVAVTPSSQPFGFVAVGNSRDLTNTITNTGISLCTVNSILVTNSVTNSTAFTLVSGFSPPFPLPAQSSTNVVVRYSPAAAGNDAGTLQVSTDDPASPARIALSGTGVGLSSNCAIQMETSLDFGSVTVGTSNQLVLVVSNTGVSDCNVNSILYSGTSEFSFTAPPTPFPVVAGGAVSIPVRYAPTSPGTDVAPLVFITDDPLTNQVTVTLSGTGFQRNLVLTPTNALAFGSIPVGSASTKSVVLSNTNSVSCNVDAIRIDGSGDFQLDAFVPTSSFTLSNRGDDNGTLVIESRDAGGPIDVALSGRGLQPYLTVTPSALAFGSVVVGATNTITVKITNAGNTNCTVTGLRVINDGNVQFTAPALPINLGPSSNVNVAVEYVPKNVQTIIIQSGALKSSGKPVAP